MNAAYWPVAKTWKTFPIVIQHMIFRPPRPLVIPQGYQLSGVCFSGDAESSETGGCYGIICYSII